MKRSEGGSKMAGESKGRGEAATGGNEGNGDINVYVYGNAPWAAARQTPIPPGVS